MLTPEQKTFYADNGYLVIRGLLTPDEAAMYRAETHAMMERIGKYRDNDATWGAAKGMTEKKTVLQHCHDGQFQTAAFARLLTDERLTGVAADIIGGGGNVQLHHCKSFVKPPEKGSPFPLHQDAPFFPHDNHSMIAAILFFDDAPLEKGCVCVVPGSHKAGMLPHIAEGAYHLDPAEYPLDSAIPLPTKAGDAVFFSYLTIHGSGVNVSGEARTTMLVQMRDPLDPPSIRTHESRAQGMMLRGFDPSYGNTKPSSEAHGNAAPMGMGMGKM